MSLASMSRGREIGVITTLLSIFGAVEARQMRALFSHLKDAQNAAIMSRMYREGLIWYGSRHQLQIKLWSLSLLKQEWAKRQ